MKKAKIYIPAKTAMQSGRGKQKKWILEFETKDTKINPLMGWESSTDTLEEVTLKFSSKEKAIEYAEKKLATQTASSSGTLQFTSSIDSTYNIYKFRFVDLHAMDDRGKPIYTAKDLISNLEKMGKVVDGLTKLEEIVKREEQAANTNRGGVEVNKYNM